ncbi:MAG: hypothetical protein ACE5Z5_01950 [Candidatus Bathyarchaeia archaeon]
MPSKKHEELLKEYMKRFEEEGCRVIRLDKMGVPDAILVKNGEVSALLIETKGISELRYDETRELRNYSEFDKQIIVMPKPRGRSVREYRWVQRLYKEGYNKKQISEITEIPYSVVWDWLAGNYKPLSIKNEEKRRNNEIFIYYE